MSVATNTAAPCQPPDPPQDRPSDGVAPDRIARLLVLVRWIIAYGTELAATLHQRAAQPDFGGWALRYRQSDLATIAARIKRGLLLAAGLEAHLTGRAARNQDLPSVPARTPAARNQRPADAGKPARAPRRTHIIDLPLDRLPTGEEIAEELRRRPVGAVVVDICRDLGIREGDLPPELRKILRDTVMFEGGNLLTLLFKEADQRTKDIMADPAHPWLQPLIPPNVAAAGVTATRSAATGPP